MARFVTRDTNPGSLRISLSRLSKGEQNKHAPLLANDDLESGDEAFKTPSSPNRSPDQDGDSASDWERSGESCNDHPLWTQSYMCPIDCDVDDISINKQRKGRAKLTKTHRKNAQQDTKSAEKKERPKRGHKEKLPKSSEKSICPVERESELENAVLEVPQKKCSQPKKAQDVPERSDKESNEQTNKHILRETVPDQAETQKTQSSVQSPDLSRGNRKSEHSDKPSDKTDLDAESVSLQWKDRGSKRSNEDSSSSSGLDDDTSKRRIKKTPKRRRQTSEDPDSLDWLIVGSSDRPRAKRNRRGKRNRKGEKKPRQGPIDCEVCGRSISCKAIMERHMLTHTGEKPFECSDCGRRYTSSSNLRIHQQSHTGKMDFSCEVCGQKFTHLPYLNRHLLRHSGKKLHICDQCGKGFIQKYHMERHMLVHTDKMPYACDKCGACFKRSDCLNLHMRSVHLCEGKEIDLKPKLHKCDLCEKTFVSRNGLEAHRRVHTGVTPYSCTICQRKFKQSSQMHSHMRTHSGEKLHSCDLCGMKFTRKNYVRKHKERKHPHERASQEQS